MLLHKTGPKLKTLFFLVVFVFCCLGNILSQIYPVQVTAQLQPPFSGYIPDYATPGNQNLKLLVLFTDFTKPSYSIKLKIKISGQNVNIQSKGYYYAGPFTVQPGLPIEISGSDLSGLLNTNNLDFSGISLQQYNQQKVLPEGAYNICFTAYDYNNPTQIQVSNESCAYGWMVLNDPPFLNIPMCGSTTSVFNPQNILFQWTPMNLSSINSAFNTEYDFELYEIIPSTQSAGNIIQTLPPIYKITTPLTFVNYGITEPVLNVGMEYVWRVRAKDVTGRDVFKNNGYSQQCTFHYGNIASQIDSTALKLHLQGTAFSHRGIKYTWDSLSLFTSYRLEYRKKGWSNWFAENTYSLKTIVNNLEAENTYEARVKGIYSDGEGPWSDIVEVTTPKQQEVVCGQATLFNPSTVFNPLTNGMIGQIWDVNDFEMIVTQLEQSNTPNGIYSGYGKIAIPFLLHLNLNVKFTNIVMNEEMRLVQGKVDVISSGIQGWSPPPGWNENDIVTYNGVISSVDTSNGSIIVNGTVVGNIGSNTTITGSGGSIYYVSSNGTISTSDGTPGAPVKETSSLLESLPIIEFTDGTNPLFAFDSKTNSTQTAGRNYDLIKKGDNEYAVAYKLLQTGSKDNLTATLINGTEDIELNTLIFKRTDGTIIPSTKLGNRYQLEIKGKLNLHIDALWAFAKKQNSTDTSFYALGKINLISVDKKKKKIVLIPVNNYGQNVDATTVKTELNKIYGKVAVEWEVTKTINLQVTAYNPDSLLKVNRTLLNTSYGSDLKNIINAYKLINTNIDDAISYLFLVNKATSNDLGYMALNKKFGFIFLNNNNNIPLTIAHEVGHGNLVLEHTFTGDNGGNSQNLLDYNNGTLFNHTQFKIIHDPDMLQNLLAGLVQDEDAGALQNNIIKTHFSTLYSSFDSDCLQRGTDRAMQAYGKPSSTIYFSVYTGLLEILLCETEESQIPAGSSSFTKFSYGFANEMFNTIDLDAMSSGITELILQTIELQLKCLFDPKQNQLAIANQFTSEDYTNKLKCIVGVTPQELKDLAEAAVEYVKDNYTNPYFQGKAAAFIATTVIPMVGELKFINVTKALAKIKDVQFLQKITSLSSKIKGKTVSQVTTILKGLKVSKYSRSAISKINGFSDNIATLASQQGIDLNTFKSLQQKEYQLMTAIEKSKIDAIRNSISMPDGNTILQKAIPKSDIPKYLNGTYNQIGGFITTAKDAKHLAKYDNIFDGMRLDYEKTAFSLADGSCGVIKYKTPNPSLTVPKDLGKFPYTGNGFTSGKNGNLGVPEWKSPYSTPNDGAELWEVFSDGTEILRAKFSTNLNKFTPVL